jgi:quinol monooxygenase YgiN
MIIVAGWLRFDPGDRERFLDDRKRKILLTREEPGCIEYTLSADSIEPNLVRVFECWESRGELEARRQKEGAAPRTDTALKSVAKHILIYEVQSCSQLD